jgi:hypothetical protein
MPVATMVFGAIVQRERLGLIRLMAMGCCAAGLLLALTKLGGRLRIEVPPIHIATCADIDWAAKLFFPINMSLALIYFYLRKHQ